MTTAGPTICGTGASRDLGATYTSWTTPENITAEDGANFATSVEGDAGTDALKITNFAWSVPAGSTISNVLVEAKGKVAVGSTSLIQTNLWNAAYSQQGFSFTSATAFDTTLTWRTMYNDNPNAGFDAAVIANTDIIEFNGYAAVGTAWSFDAVRVTITYATATGAKLSQSKLVAPGVLGRLAQ